MPCCPASVSAIMSECFRKLRCGLFRGVSKGLIPCVLAERGFGRIANRYFQKQKACNGIPKERGGVGWGTLSLAAGGDSKLGESENPYPCNCKCRVKIWSRIPAKIPDGRPEAVIDQLKCSPYDWMRFLLATSSAAGLHLAFKLTDWPWLTDWIQKKYNNQMIGSSSKP